VWLAGLNSSTIILLHKGDARKAIQRLCVTSVGAVVIPTMMVMRVGN
jgi:hypothetical protein